MSCTAEPTGSTIDPAMHEDWRWQMRRSIRTAHDLAQALNLSPEEYEAAEAAQRSGFPIAITPYYLSLCEADNRACPIRLQVVPSAREHQIVPGDLRDPLGEEAHEVAPDLVQRYPDRALLLVSDRCAVYCRFCTRSRMVGAGGGPRPIERLAPALQYLRAHPEITDVIISGGDPLTMATDRFTSIVSAVRAVPSVETIRIATRVPVTLPQRITSELVAALTPYHPIWVMTHFNHPRELTPESRRACKLLVESGFPVNNQTVLLRGVNDDASTLSTLFRALVRERVRPYYLLQADPVRGTGHLRTPVQTGIDIMEQLQGRLSGIAIPRFILDAPGGFGKVPIGPNYIVARGAGYTRVRTARGVAVDYFDPPSD